MLIKVISFALVEVVGKAGAGMRSVIYFIFARAYPHTKSPQKSKEKYELAPPAFSAQVIKHTTNASWARNVGNPQHVRAVAAAPRPRHIPPN